jgi:hypothetical protein
MIPVLICLISCTAGVDIGEVNRIVTAFSITWPSDFKYHCQPDEPVIVTINTLDQNGSVFDSWSGVVIISCNNVNVSVNPSILPVIRGSEEIEIAFESTTEEVQQVKVIFSYD